MSLPIVYGSSNVQPIRNKSRRFWLLLRCTTLTKFRILCFLYLILIINLRIIFPSIKVFDSYNEKNLMLTILKQRRMDKFYGTPSINTTANNFDHVAINNNIDTSAESNKDINVVEHHDDNLGKMDSHYSSGIFGSNLTDTEKSMQHQCKASALMYGAPDPCFGSGTIETNVSCCYCYDRYPSFVIIDDKWSVHRHKFGSPPTTKPLHQSNELLYWFCAEPTNNTIVTIMDEYEAVKDEIIVVSGKFGHDDKFRDEVINFCNALKGSGLIHFPNMFCYSETPSFVLEDTRFFRHLRYRTKRNDVSARGGGYWFHKSVLLLHHMENAEDGKLLIWADNDRFNFFQNGHFQGLMVTFQQRKADFAIEELVGLTEKQWTKEDLLYIFNASEAVRESNQMNANAIVVRNSPKMRQFVRAWVDCVSNWHMVSDEGSIIPNGNAFMENRHDQSIIGLLVKSFLSNDYVIGPPARTYQESATLHTFQLDDKNLDLVVCPYTPDAFQLSVGPPSTNFDNIQYISGVFDSPLTDHDRTIQTRCRESSLIYGRSDPCFGSSIINSDATCCFCYDRYPNFVFVDDQWSTHMTNFGSPPVTKPIHQTNEFQYWFCVETQNNTIDTDWAKYDNIKENIVVVSGKFGNNDPFRDAVNHFCGRLKESDLVNDSNVYCYSELPAFVVDDKRFERHLRYRIDPNDVSARGSGYWFYKSVLLRHHMQNSDDGKVIIWADNERLNFFQNGHFQGLMTTFEDRRADFAIEELVGCPEKQWSKEDILFSFNASEAVRESNQFNANAMVIRNSPKMRRFIDAWVECVSNWHMLSDENSIIPNGNVFSENRHDQSVLGLLVKQFLSNQTIIGPPARSFQDGATLHTFQLDDSNVELVTCPFGSFQESIIKTKIDFKQIQYNSGVFGSTLSETETLIQSQCKSSSLLYGKSDPCFGSRVVESNTSCCYCYDRYPNFVVVDDVWSSHVNKFGTPPTSKENYQTQMLRYWLCAEPRDYTTDIDWNSYQNIKNNIVVVTGKFGHNDKFRDDVTNFCNQLKEYDRVNNTNVHCYSESPAFVLDDTRFVKHLQYRTDPDDISSRGGGYWFHKSVLLRHHMENEDDGKYIIWADNDRLNFFQHGHFQGLMVTFEERGADLAIEELVGCPEKQWSKEDILFSFNASVAMRDSNQLNANAIVVRNSPKMRRLVDAWVECVSNWHMVSDEKSVLPNGISFMENRHDQSILGLLVKHFLSNETIIGPPARPYQDSATLYTFHLEDSKQDHVHCPFTDIAFLESIAPQKVNFDKVQFNSGVFGASLPEHEEKIKQQCKSSSLLYGKSDPCFGSSIIESNTSCCFCYDRYPNFVRVDDQWSTHMNKVGAPPTPEQKHQTHELLYWFCVEPQNNIIDTVWTKYDKIKDDIVVVSGKFGNNDPFRDAVNHFCGRLKESKLVNDAHVFCYSELPAFILEDKRFERHLRYRTDPNDVSARGSGYWFYKSVLLRHHMQNSDDGKIFIWADNERLNFFQNGHFQGLMTTFEDRRADFAIEELVGCPEKQWSKEDMLFSFNASEAVRDSNQFTANAIVVRNSPKMRRFIDAWVDCVSNWHMLSDEDSFIPNGIFFVENRHDQSLLGLLAKQFLSNITIIGPPARSFQDSATLHTFHMDDNKIDLVKCPF